MQNSYLIDAFLSFWLWLSLAVMYIDVTNLVKKANMTITPDIFAIYFDMTATTATLVAFLPMALYGFLLWRFCSLIMQAGMWGAGSVGLLIILCIMGLGLIWLKVLITIMLHKVGVSIKTEQQPLAVGDTSQKPYSEAYKNLTNGRASAGVI